MDDLRQVLLQDLLPGGLEPIDPNVVRAGGRDDASPLYSMRSGFGSIL